MGVYRSLQSVKSRSRPLMRSAARFPGQVAKLGDHHQIFEPAEVTIRVRLFRYVAHATLVGDEVVLDALAIEEDLAGGHFHQAGNHFHGGGFTRSVWPQIAGDLAGARDEAHIIDGQGSLGTFW